MTALLSDDLKIRLPPLLSQEAEDEPVVYARYYLPGTCWEWYAIEGEARDGDFAFYGFVKGMDDAFSQFRLSELQGIRGPAGETVQRDFAFIEGRLTDVVPASDH